MASNHDPFVRSSRKDGLPVTFKGLVKAGATQALKMGELCALSKTYAGYFSPVATAALDYIYPLAIVKEEQKSDDLERYIDFYALAPEDQFEFEIDSARSLALGDTFALTGSDTESLTYDADGYPVATCVDDGHYPQGTNTTIRNRSYATVIFNIACTYYGLVMTRLGAGITKVVNRTSALTLYHYMNNLIITNLGASGNLIHVLPTTPPLDFHATTFCLAAYDNGFEVGSQGAFYVENAKQTDDKNVSVDAIGDSCRAHYIGGGDWFAECVVTSNADQTGAIDVEG